MQTKITILGAGPGGYVAAVRAAQLGAEVTLVERDNPGGTCLNRGCIPSKVMKTSAELLERFKRSGEFGIRTDASAVVDMALLMERKRKVVDTQVKGIFGLLKHHDIRYVSGKGVATGPGKLSVSTSDGQSVDVTWDRLIVATGSEPMNIPAFPFDGKNVISSNEALELAEVPESMLIVGGGVIGCEFASIYAAFGSKVAIVEALPRLLPLPAIDGDCSKIIQREMKKRKIRFMVDKTVENVGDSGGELKVTVGPSPFAEKKDAKRTVETVQKVLVCIGRSSNAREIGLDTIGVETDEKGWIAVNERMETNVPGVYAIGDVLGPSKVMLAHVASAEGAVAAENAMGKNRAMNYDAIPGAIFTMPEVANVGLTEARAKENGIDVKCSTVLFRAIGKPHVIGEIAGQAKIVSDAGTGKVLGVHIVGPHATDLIAEGALAVETECSVDDIAKTIHAHPTLAEIMSETAFKSVGRSLHG